MMMADKIQTLLLWVRVYDPRLELLVKNLKQYLTFIWMTAIVQCLEYLTYISDVQLKPDIITCLSNYTGSGLTPGLVFSNFCLPLHATNGLTL